MNIHETVMIFALLMLGPVLANAEKSEQQAADLKSFIKTLPYPVSNSRGSPQETKGRVCEAMKSVGLRCSYNDRGALVDFLFVNGKNLFPCKGGSNPYTKDSCDIRLNKDPDAYNYIGQPIQNDMLATMIEKNRNLFSGGNLTAENAKKWKM